MPTRFSFRLAEIFGALLLFAILLAAWRADRRDRAKLAADLAVAKQSLAQADARQHARDAQLAQTLSAIAAEKRAVTTPTQILRALPKQIPLPSPITLQSVPPSCGPTGFVECGGLVHPELRRAAALTTEPNHPTSPHATKQPEDLTELHSKATSTAARQPEPQTADSKAGKSAQQLILPAADLKPLYNYTLDCQACQAKLSTAQADLTDERTKSTILTRERDEAIRAAKGGSLLRRVARNAKWLAIGAIAGAVAARAHP